MSEETKRPRGGGGDAPFGMRARNRTMVMDSDKINSLRSQVERPAAATNTPAAPPAVDASALDVFGGDDYASPQPVQDAGFMELEDVLGVAENAPDTTTQGDPFDPFASEQADPFGAFDAMSEEPPVEPSPASVVRPSTPLQSLAEESPPPQKIVRSVPAMTTPPKTPEPPVDEEVFDPFASMEDTASQSQASRDASAFGDDLDSVFGELPTMEDMPVAPIAPATQTAAPKIVRPGDLGAAHERVIVPPPPPPQAPPIHLPAATPAATKETQTAPKEIEAMTEPRDHIHWKADSPLVGFLVTYDHDHKGSYVELRQGRLMVSNQREESGSCLVVLGDSISPMHAIMRVAPGGVVQVLDQLSEAGTRVKHMGQEEEEFLSGEKSTVSHGDIIFFGDRKFHVLLVVGQDAGE